MAEDKSQKTEKPTGQRRKQAREEGNVARTPDLSGWLTVAASAAMLNYTVGQMHDVFTTQMGQIRDTILQPSVPRSLEFFGQAIVSWLWLCMPIACACALVGALGHIVQGGGKAYAKRVKPKWSKLNPMAGIKNLFGMQATWNLTKTLLKFVVFGWIAYDAVQGTMHKVTGSGMWSLGALLTSGAETTLSVVWKVAITGLVIALADYMMERRRVEKSIMMTKDEVRRENKQQEGSPELKGAIRARQREMGRRRMMSAVADASVVMANPTHISVALKYTAGEGAPQVVAKGSGHLALRIRQEAEQNLVPVVEDVIVTRMLYKACDVDDYIPFELYDAIAQVLAFVMFLAEKGQAAGSHPSPVSSPDQELPDDLTDEALGVAPVRTAGEPSTPAS